MTTSPVETRPRYSIVIPTFQRRDLVLGAVQALASLSGPSFEAIVVVDGSTDGTAEALRALRVLPALTVMEQPNAGRARAVNRGAGLGQGDILLFLDDDMIAAEDLLVQHDQAYAAGADAVLGHIPVAPDSPRTFLSRGLAEWAEKRRSRLIADGGQLSVSDLVTGQFSVRREVFGRLTGFDEQFTRDGSFGGEDTDLGRRLFDEGYRVVFAPDAVSWQYYAVSPRAYLKQWYQAGTADVAYLRKHPSEFEAVLASRRPGTRSNKYLVRPLARIPGLASAVAAAVRPIAVGLAEWRPEDRRAERIFFKVRNLEYWRGVQGAGGLPRPRPFRILCFHAVSDLRGAARLEQYGVPRPLFRRQLRLLLRVGFRFVSLAEVLNALTNSSGLPRGSVLLTFDDCYPDLLTNGLPVLQEQRAPAAAFAVAGLVGGTNTWDTAIGAPELALLDAAGLRALEKAQVDIGVHGSTHRVLVALSEEVLQEETAAAAATLTAYGLRPPRAFAYPHGENDAASRRAVATAGLVAGFTVTSDLVRPGRVDPYAVPRIEVLRRDGAGPRLLLKVLLAGRLPRLAPPSAASRLKRGLARRLRTQAGKAYRAQVR